MRRKRNHATPEPSSMEEERRCAPISPHEARSRHAVRLTRSRGVGSGKESNPIPRYEKPRGRDSAHRQREGKRWTLPPPCKESAGGSSASRRRWCPKSVKVFSPATAGCAPGLAGLEPDVSRRSSCSGELRLEGSREGARIDEEQTRSDYHNRLRQNHLQTRPAYHSRRGKPCSRRQQRVRGRP